MNSRIEIPIEIPSDENGFVLLQCPLCGELFKLTVKDIEAEDVVEIWCPSCGLVSENYLSEEIIDLAMKKTKNTVNDLLHKELKQMEQKFNGGFITFKVSTPPKKEYESSLVPIIDSLVAVSFRCCNRQAKITPSLKATTTFCPFCGVNYEHE